MLNQKNEMGVMENSPSQAGGLEDAHYGPWHKKMLQELDHGEHAKMFEIITNVVTERREIFLEGDAEFKIQYERFQKMLKANNHLSGNDYFKFLTDLVEPFWVKVGEAGTTQISDVHFQELESVL